MAIAKVSRPTARGLVPRGRLFRVLDARRPLTWVWGPPGAGKTALVTCYLHARRIRTLWYRCDVADVSAEAFLSYLGPASGRRSGASGGDVRLAVRALLGGLRGPFAIVLDGYDDMPEESPVHDAIRQIVAELPASGRVIVISRGEPPAGFARLRAARAIGEVGWPELRLTSAEARALVRHLSPSTPAQLVAALQERAAGWAAGLVLMLGERRGLSHERRRTPDGIVDYFASEILNRADAATQEFLLQTAFLPRLNGAMADALVERSGATHVLARLHRQNCFIVQHAAPSGLYEYHPLFRAFLLRRAYAVLTVDQRAAIQRRAAELLARDGQRESAAAMLRDAGDWDGLARLIDAYATTLAAEGRGALVDEWIAGIPPEAVRERPWVLFWRAARRLAAAPAIARADLEEALARFRRTRDARGAFLAWALAVETFPVEQEDFQPLDGYIAVLDELRRELGDFPSLEVETRVTSSMVLALACRQPAHPEITRWMRRALDLAEKTSDPEIRLRSMLHVLTYRLWVGDLENARVLAADVRTLTSTTAVSHAGRLVSALMLARLAWLTADFAGARDTIEAALALGHAAGVTAFRHTLIGEAAMVALSSGDHAGAQLRLGDLRRDLPRLSRFARAYYHFLVGWEALQRGDAAGARGAQEAVLATTSQCGMPWLQCLAHLLAAHVLDATREADAEAHLTRAQRLAHGFGSPLMQFMIALAEADTASRSGDEGRVVQALARAMPLGRAHGYVNTWMWSPAAMAHLAVSALDAEIEVDYVQRLVRERTLVPAEAPVEIEAWPWPVKVFTLGRFEVLTRERPVAFTGKAQRKPLALLQALIALGGRRVREDRLTELLWPHADGDAAHQALSTTLHRLRRLLGNERALIRHDSTITLAPEQCWVDLWAVERLLARAESAISRSPVRDHEWAASLRWTDRTMILYRGDFLSGDASLPMAATVGERLRDRVLRQLRKLGQLWESMRDWEEAALCYERAVTINECAEEFYRRLMVAYLRLDRRGDAILAYQRCRKSLRTVLGIAPSTETEALRRSIQSSDC
jgi:LuxR family maltose regulon positive regulatory protein